MIVVIFKQFATNERTLLYIRAAYFERAVELVIFTVTNLVMQILSSTISEYLKIYITFNHKCMECQIKDTF